MLENEEYYLISPYDLKKLNEDTVYEITQEIRKEYNPYAVSPFELSCNIEVIAKLIQIYSYMASKCEGEYALKKLDVEFKKNKKLKDLRKSWDESILGKAPAIDYFKAAAANEVKDEFYDALKCKLQADNFKAAAQSYEERIAAIKYKIKSVMYEEKGV